MLGGSRELASPVHSRTGPRRSYLISHYVTAGECIICSDDLRQSRLFFHIFDIIFQGCQRALLPRGPAGLSAEHRAPARWFSLYEMWWWDERLSPSSLCSRCPPQRSRLKRSYRPFPCMPMGQTQGSIYIF